MSSFHNAFWQRAQGAQQLTDTHSTMAHSAAGLLKRSGIGLLVLILSCYVSATAYFTVRDPLISALMVRQAKLEAAYEDRLAAVRGEMDRLASHQLLNQNSFDGKLHEIISRQAQLEMRNTYLEALSLRAQASIAATDGAPSQQTARSGALTATARMDLPRTLTITDGGSIHNVPDFMPTGATIPTDHALGQSTGAQDTGQDTQQKTGQDSARSAPSSTGMRDGSAPAGKPQTGTQSKPKVEDDTAQSHATPLPKFERGQNVTQAVPLNPAQNTALLASMAYDPAWPAKHGKPTLGMSSLGNNEPMQQSRITLIAKMARLDGLPPSQSLGALTTGLDTIEHAQLSMLDQISTLAKSQNSKIAGAFETAGLGSVLAKSTDKSNGAEKLASLGSPSESTLLQGLGKRVAGGTGGPLIAPQNTAQQWPSASFEGKIMGLESALRTLEAYKSALPLMPLRQPLASGIELTSGFGFRTDPFTGRPALHSGLDLREHTGAYVRATAAGVVTSAGAAGGYGNMVEIDHGNGFSTRFGHLSEILAHEGARVAIGDVIGRVGSTGRSTGPHLHYEVRLDDEPIDPLRFLRAGYNLGLVNRDFSAKQAPAAKDEALD